MLYVSICVRIIIFVFILLVRLNNLLLTCLRLYENMIFVDMYYVFYIIKDPHDCSTIYRRGGVTHCPLHLYDSELSHTCMTIEEIYLQISTVVNISLSSIYPKKQFQYNVRQILCYFQWLLINSIFYEDVQFFFRSTHLLEMSRVQ